MTARSRPRGPAVLIAASVLFAAAIARSQQPPPPAGDAPPAAADTLHATPGDSAAAVPAPPLADTIAAADSLAASADSLGASADSFAALLDSLATPLPSPATFLWDALAGTPGAVTLAPRAVGENDPLSAAHLLERIGLLEMTPSGSPTGVPEWYANQGLGPGWVDLRVDGLRPAVGHSAAPMLDLSPLETAGAFLWVPGPMAALAGTGAAGGALFVRMPDAGAPRARSLAGASTRFYGTSTGALSFATGGRRQGLAFDYSDRSTDGREAYGGSWTRTFGGRLSRYITESVRALAWGHGFEGRARLFDGTKLERRGRATAAGFTHEGRSTRTSLQIAGASEEMVVNAASGLTRRRGSDLSGEASLHVEGLGAAGIDLAAGLARGHATWRDRGLAMPPWESTRAWTMGLASVRPVKDLALWGGARWDGEGDVRARFAPAAAAEWTPGAVRLWAAASRGFGDPVFPAASNDFRALALQGLGLIDRSGTVRLPEVRRLEAGAAVGAPGEDRWARIAGYTSEVRDAFVGAPIGEAPRLVGTIAGGALDSLRAGASTIGIEAAARWPLVWGFYARGRAAVARDRDGGDPAHWAIPPESALGALGLRHRFFKGDLLATAEIIADYRSETATPFFLDSPDGPVRIDLDAATIVTFRFTGDVERRFHVFYEVENLLNEEAGSRTFVSDIGPIFLPGRNYSVGILWRLLD